MRRHFCRWKPGDYGCRAAAAMEVTAVTTGKPYNRSSASVGRFIGKSFQSADRGQRPIRGIGMQRLCHYRQAPFRRLPPLVAGATTFAPVGSVSLDSQSPKGSLRIQFPCHPAKAVGLWAPGNSGNGDYDSNDGKTIQPGLWPVGNAPLLSPAATSPPEGEILAALYIVMLMRTNAERREVYSAP